MPRVHRLQHVKCLGAAHFTQYDTVGTHAQGIADEFALRDLADAFDIGRARLHLHDMRLQKTKLDCVFDCYHTFIAIDIL